MKDIVAYMEKEVESRRDLRGNPISLDILLYDDTRCLEFFVHTWEHASSAEAWGREIALYGDEAANHNNLEYMRDHVFPYLKDLGNWKATIDKMAELVALAAKRTNYWNDFGLEDDDHPRLVMNSFFYIKTCDGLFVKKSV